MVQLSLHNNMYEELVEGCGTSSGLDVTMEKWGATWVSLEGLVVVQTIGKTYIRPLVSQNKSSYLFSISTLMSLVSYKTCPQMKVSFITLEYTVLKCVKLPDCLSDLHKPLINQISSGTSLGASTGPADNCFICVCVHGFPTCIPSFARREKH